MQNNPKTNYSLVLPIHNPPDKWLETVITDCHELINILNNCSLNVHIINDGEKFSDDHSLNELYVFENLNINLHHYFGNKGKGFALRYGFEIVKNSSGHFAYSDWDFPFGIEPFVKAFALLENNDLILGNRGNDYFKQLPFFRKLISFSQRSVNKYILNLTNSDTQAGFKVFNKKGLESFLSTKINGFLFDTEFVVKAKNNSCMIKEIPINCRKGLHFKNFKFKVLFSELLNVKKLFKD